MFSNTRTNGIQTVLHKLTALSALYAMGKKIGKIYGEKCKKPCSVFGLRPSVSFCSASTKNFHFGASLLRAY